MPVRLTIRAKPRAKKSRVVAANGLTAEIALAAPPVDGAANDELVDVLSDVLGVPKRAIHISVGTKGRNKIVDVDDIEPADAAARLEKAAKR